MTKGFKYAHHAVYIVYNIREAADFLYRNFGMAPWQAGEHPPTRPNRGIRSIVYRVGSSLLDFSEPYLDLDGESIVRGGAADLWATQLRGTGPGIFHLAWAVENIDSVVQGLVENNLRMDPRHNDTGRALHDSYLPFYKVCNILPDSVGPSFAAATRGQVFQLAEGVPGPDDLANSGNLHVNVLPVPEDERVGPADGLRGIHHVTYVVYNVRELADFLERNFGMVPFRADEYGLDANPAAARGSRVVTYLVDRTIIEICEPLLDGGDEAVAKGGEAELWALKLQESGPGLFNIGWAVEGIDRIYDNLLKRGVEVLNEPESHPVLPFYRRVNIAPTAIGASFSRAPAGQFLQIAEGLPSAEYLESAGNLDWRALPARSDHAPGGYRRLPDPESAFARV